MLRIEQDQVYYRSENRTRHKVILLFEFGGQSVLNRAVSVARGLQDLYIWFLSPLCSTAARASRIKNVLLPQLSFHLFTLLWSHLFSAFRSTFLAFFVSITLPATAAFSSFTSSPTFSVSAPGTFSVSAPSLRVAVFSSFCPSTPMPKKDCSSLSRAS